MQGGVTLPIVHFNDVYRVRQKVRGPEGVLGADQFAAKINAIRRRWHERGQTCQRAAPAELHDWREHQARDRQGLVLFSGDLYNPSVESSVTRGVHMVPVINAMQVDAACVGNHDWDFGYPHLQTLMDRNNFPWLFSNVVDAAWRTDGAPGADGASPTDGASSADGNAPTDGSSPADGAPSARDKQVEPMLPYFTMVVAGVKVACVGLVEREWLDTVPDFPEHFEYRDMDATAMQLSRELREGPEQCELIIALTHCRLPNDVVLANALGAVAQPDPTRHGVDLVLGGHDHVYYVGRGVQTYEGSPFDRDMAGSADDQSTYLVKSGADFHDLSEIAVQLSAPHAAPAVRRRTIERMCVRRHATHPDDPSEPTLRTMLDTLMARIARATGQPVAYSLTPWDARAPAVRLEESALGDFVADILLTSVERALRTQHVRDAQRAVRGGGRLADCCLICGGSLRGDAVFGPGEITLGTILEIMPFEDPVVVLELSGRDLWDALENGFSAYPRQEGRFPQFAGMRVVWDSHRPPGRRVRSVDLLHEPIDGVPDGADDAMRSKLRSQYQVSPLRARPGAAHTALVHRAALQVREPLQLGRTYRVVTRQYMASGNDGYSPLARGRYIVDDENGQLMSTIVRKYLLGATYIWRSQQLRTRARLHPPCNDAAAAQGATRTPPPPDTQTGSAAGGPPPAHSASLAPQTQLAVQRACDLSVRQARASDAPRGDAALPAAAAPLPADAHAPQSPAATDEDGALVVDQSPVGIRDALFVGAHEHHSGYDSASRTFDPAEPVDADAVPVDTAAVRKAALAAPGNLAVVIALADGRMGY
ncbi:hypothetical protein MSPP1_000925 [Malassezia sp. CBS 17886]|nr:hypothetical protein MSPP1_000925 [Malassezia sp. CBS 17886]